MKKTRSRILPSILLGSALASACGGGGGDEGDKIPPPAFTENPQYRAIAGISMGAYGAMNLGTKHADGFGVIGSLGGPVDMSRLLRDAELDGLAVMPQTASPGAPDEDFTFDHMPPYPSRDLRISQFKDLVIAFGDPFLHHPDAARQYLAADSEPAQLRVDDRFGSFVIPDDPRGFLDGGDRTRDGVRQLDEPPTLPTDVLLTAVGSLAAIAPGSAATLLGGRQLADLSGDGVYDVGDGLVLNPREPYEDSNQNGVRDADEPFSDTGLDGVAGSGDYGEGNGRYDEDPDRAHWLAEDPLSRLAVRPADQITAQRIYMDVGTMDEFGFAQHYANLVEVLDAKGIAVDVKNGFSGNCAAVPAPSSPFLLIRYEGGHVGIPDDDTITDDLLNGDFCGPSLTIWQRLITLVGFVNESFPDGNFGTGRIDIDFEDFDFGDLDLRGDIVSEDIPSPALALDGGDVPTQHVVVYRPVKFFHSDASFPIVYFLGGYGQKPDDFRRVGDLLDILIATRELQNMYFAFLPGAGGQRGSFYVNHTVPETQVPDAIGPTSGRYEDSIVSDLIPYIEREIVRGRVRR